MIAKPLQSSQMFTVSWTTQKLFLTAQHLVFVMVYVIMIIQTLTQMDFSEHTLVMVPLIDSPQLGLSNP